MSKIRPYIPVWLLIFIFITTASYSESGPANESPATHDREIKILQSWQGNFPISQLHLLSKDQQNPGVGYIDNFSTFSSVWKAFDSNEKTPDIDFTTHLVLFARNTRFYNRISIGRITVKDSVAEILAMETMSAMPIEDKVAFSMAVIEKNGINGIRFGNEIIKIP